MIPCTITEMAEREMLAFDRISDFKGTSDKREFQLYAVVFFITLLIINGVSLGPIGPIELSFRLVGLILVLLPLPALMTRRLRELGYMMMGKVWLGAFVATLLLELNYRLSLMPRFVMVEALISISTVGLGAILILLCFFKSSKVKAVKK